MGYRNSSNGTWNGRKCALGCDGPAFFWPREGGLFGESVLHQPVVHLTLLRLPPTPHSDSVPYVDLPRGSRWAWQLRSPEWNTHRLIRDQPPVSAGTMPRSGGFWHWRWCWMAIHAPRRHGRTIWSRHRATWPRLIEGSIPTEATVAHVLVLRYADHLPLYRQAKIWAR